MGIPQIIIIVLIAMDLGIHLVKNGEPRDDKYSFPIAFVSAAIDMGLLYWGGFFS